MIVAAESITASRAYAGAREWAQEGGVAVLAVAVLVPVAAVDGGYFAPAWGWTAAALAWAAGVALALRRRIHVSRLEMAALAGLGGLALWTAASLAWSPAAGPAVLEVQRTLVYVAALLAVLAAVRASSYRSLAAGVWAAATLVSAYALLTRLFPDQFDLVHTVATNRLSAPIGYWNALGTLAALGAVLAFGFVAHARGPGIRALAATSLVPLSLTIYFTFSRGAWLAVAAGLVTAFALESARLRLFAAIGVTVPFAAAAVALASRSEPLTSLAGDPGAADDGPRVFALAVGLAIGAAVAALAFGFAAARVRLGDGRRRAVGAALVAILVIGAAVVMGRLGGPAEMGRDAWASFKAPPVPTTSLGSLNERLFTLSGTWRVDLWRVALDAYAETPWTGGGAGTYERAWLERRPSAVKVRDAHSVYLETLAELGPLGVGFLLLALAAPLVGAVRSRRRAMVPAAAGAYAAFAAHAAVDWDWEIPALTLAALFAGGACLAAARSVAPPRPLGGRARAALVAAAVAVAAVALLGLVGNRAAAASEDAAATERLAHAEKRARDAVRWMPWSAAPWQLLGEAQLLDGRLAEARTSFREGIRRDPGSWELWLDLAFASESPEMRRRAARRAAALNPLAPEIHSVGPALGLGEESLP